MTIDQLEEREVGEERIVAPETPNRHGFAVTLSALIILFLGLVFALFNVVGFEPTGRISVGTSRQAVTRTADPFNQTSLNTPARTSAPPSTPPPSPSTPASPPASATKPVPAPAPPAPKPAPPAPAPTATLVPIPSAPPNGSEGQLSMTSQCSFDPATGSESIVVNVDNPARVMYQVIVHFADQAWPSSVTNNRSGTFRREAHPYPSAPPCWAEVVRR